MPRPLKDNADYFSHDADMRDDPKIKALRRKFKISGYGVWCMLLEALTDSDNFRLTVDLEIIAGDFDVDTELLQSVIDYCLQINLLQTDDGGQTIYSQTLDKRFSTLISKRKRDRKELSPSITPQTAVIDGESAQSKVKKSKVKEEDRKEEQQPDNLKNLNPEIVQKAADLTDAICNYFSVKQILMSRVYDSVCHFIATISNRNEITMAEIALQKYIAYKTQSKEQIHSVLSWIGTPDNYYQDGQWIMIDWGKKLNGLQYDSKRNAKTRDSFPATF